MMLTPPGTQPDPSDWQPTVMLHEITHNLGGVQQSAPHSTPDGHCWDGNDVMCYPDGSSGAQPYTTSVCPLVAGAIPQTYDCGHDDYFNPDPAPGSYLAHALERLHQRLHGPVRAARHGVRRQHRPHRRR